MKKEKIELQKRMNERTQLFVEWFNAQHGTPIKYKRLRKCQAIVFEFEDCYILQSYHTPVAGIRKDTGEEYDFSTHGLRLHCYLCTTHSKILCRLW